MISQGKRNFLKHAGIMGSLLMMPITAECYVQGAVIEDAVVSEKKEELPKFRIKIAGFFLLYSHKQIMGRLEDCSRSGGLSTLF